MKITYLYNSGFALCEDAELAMRSIPISDLPPGAGEGSVLLLTEEGKLILDEGARQERAERIRKLAEDLWE